MNCREFHREAGDLSREPTPTVLGHLETCPECRQWLERLVSDPPVGLTPPAWEPLPPRSLGEVLRAAPPSPHAAELEPGIEEAPVSPTWNWAAWLKPLVTGLGSLAVAGLLWFSLQTSLPPVSVPAPASSEVAAHERGPLLSFLEDLPAEGHPAGDSPPPGDPSGGGAPSMAPAGDSPPPGDPSAPEQPVEEQALVELPMDAAEGKSVGLVVTDSEFEFSQHWSFVDPERSLTFLDEEKEESWL